LSADKRTEKSVRHVGLTKNTLKNTPYVADGVADLCDEDGE